MSHFAPFDRVIVLALDSLCWEVLAPLLADRTMPSLAAFLKQAHHGVLESSCPPHTAAAWTTFLTGQDPGHHGVIDFVKFDPVKHRFSFHNSAGHRKDNILTRLSEAGVSCGSIFLPRNYPPYPLKNGYIISGFETPSTNRHFIEPDELRDEVLSVSPDLHFNLDSEWADEPGERVFGQNIERALSAVDVLERLAVHFQRERPTQVQIAYLQATDILFHKAWRWCDPDEATGREPRRQLVRRFFQRVDQLVNRAFALHASRSSQRFRPNEKTRLLRVLCSDHGHGLSNGRVYVNRLLADWGFLAPLGGLTRASRQLALLTMNAETRRARSRELPVNWARTKAYLAHVGIYGFVYINLKGREPHGIVPPEQFESVRAELIEKFAAQKIPGSGAPLFPEVMKGEQVYARKQELNLPDLILVPADGFFPRKKLTSGAPIRVTPHAVGGVHRRDGIYAFEGPGIVPSAGPGVRAHIEDIAPTLLAALGQPIPASMTGQPLLHLFAEPPKVRYTKDARHSGPQAPVSADAPANPVYTHEEEKTIEKRLADLGYLE
jgi:predicted AlkP superfamily phosphohydrolase/phosphomutase